MVQKRKTPVRKPARKTTGKTSKSRSKPASRKRKQVKPDYSIPWAKLLTVFSIVVIICSSLILINTLFERHSDKVKNVSEVSQIQKKADVQKNNSSSEMKKQAPEKTAVKQAETQKKSAEEKTSVSVKVPETEKNQKKEAEKDSVKSAVSVKNTPETTVKKSDIPAIPKAQKGAKLVVIFDDGGQNLSQLDKCIKLPFPVTVAVLPRLQYSVQCANRVRASGNELMLHQPMQAVNMNVNPGEGAIKPDMSDDQIYAVIFQNIEEIGPVAGFNNHEGSLITADADKMAAVMKFASEQGIYFLDSRTNADTKVPVVSQALGYSYYERNVFLDNTKNRSDIINEIMKGVDYANLHGCAIMIGHVWSAGILPGILEEMYPLLKAKGYVFTTVSNSGALKEW